MSAEGDHHYVPRFHLARWAGPDGKLRQWSRIAHNGKLVRKQVPTAATGYVPGLYSLEHVLPEEVQQIENKASPVLDRLITIGPQSLSVKERYWWTMYLHAAILRVPHVVGQRFDANGRREGDEFQVNAYDTGYQGISSVTGLADDSFVVTWMSIDQDGAGSGIYGQVFKINNAPVITPTRSVTTAEDTQLTDVEITASDLDADTLTYLIKNGAGPQKGAVTFDQAKGTLSYMPSVNANGEDNFTIVVSDGNGGTAEQTINVIINPVNDAPLAISPATVTVAENSRPGSFVTILSALVLQPGIVSVSSAFAPVAFSRALLMPPAPYGPVLDRFNTRRSLPHQMPEQSSHLRHGER